MKISVCMATMNEEGAIAGVLSDFRRALPGHDLEFVIVDGSTDRTPEIAAGLGARVIRQKPQGYGIALRESLLAATGDIIITTDCDGTYPAGAAPEMVRLIGEGYDVVSASRLKGRKRVPAMPLLNELGNRMFAAMVSLLYGVQCTDITTGMRAFRREVVRSMEWTENTGLSLELFFRPAAAGYRVTEVPVEYRARVGAVKLNPLSGGLSMLKTIIKYRLKPAGAKRG